MYVLNLTITKYSHSKMTKYNNKSLVKWHSYTLPIQQLYTNIYKYYINSFVNIKVQKL